MNSRHVRRASRKTKKGTNMNSAKDTATERQRQIEYSITNQMDTLKLRTTENPINLKYIVRNGYQQIDERNTGTLTLTHSHNQTKLLRGRADRQHSLDRHHTFFSS